jgi:hypothetical protein
VLARVVEKLGDLELVTSHEIEGLFAVDLAFLQDFYGVINFGSQEEYDELIQSQQATLLVGSEQPGPPEPAAPAATPSPVDATADDPDETQLARPSVRTAVEELPRPRF